MNIDSSLRVRALKYLASREYSRQELERKLANHAHSFEELVALLDELERQKILSDQRVVEQILYSKRHKYGSRRIEHELQMRGIADNLIAAALDDLKKTELSSACELWRKRFGALPANLKERGKQIRYLAGKGFPSEVINEAMTYLHEADV